MANPMQIKLIHTVKGALGLNDDDYRAVLAGYGVTSSKQLSDRDAGALLADLEAKAVAAGVWRKKGAPKRAGKRPFAGAAPVDKDGYLAKIEALLAEAGRPWAYADAMGKHMFGIERVRFCKADQLRRIVAALVYDQKRRGKRRK